MLMSELNATKAAARLGLSQAAVSASLRRLRALYGDPLFTRTQRGLLPTPRAVLLRPLIDEALGIIGTTLDGNSDRVEDRAGVTIMRIGLSDDFEMAFGAAIVRAAKQTMPGVRIVLRQTNSYVAAQALNDRDIDLAITSGGLADSRLKHQSLGSSDYRIVYDSRVRGTREPFTLQEYLARDHILVSYSGLSGVTDDVLAEHGLRRRILTATTHFSALSFILAGSDALATIPRHAAQALCGQGSFAMSPCPLPFPRYAFGVSWRFDSVRIATAMRVRDLIAETLSG
jgi:DNA-binding transcriptional LysR family regulator